MRGRAEPSHLITINSLPLKWPPGHSGGGHSFKTHKGQGPQTATHVHRHSSEHRRDDSCLGLHRPSAELRRGLSQLGHNALPDNDPLRLRAAAEKMLLDFNYGNCISGLLNLPPHPLRPQLKQLCIKNHRNRGFKFGDRIIYFHNDSDLVNSALRTLDAGEHPRLDFGHIVVTHRNLDAVVRAVLRQRAQFVID